MITAFEVGSIFRIVDQASPALRAILAEVRALNAQLDKARASLAGLGKLAMPAGLTAAVGETQSLAAAWREVAAASALASKNLATAGAAGRTAAASAAIPRGRAPSWPGRGGGGGGLNFGGPGVSTPGGRVSSRGPAAAGAGLLGYGVYEAAEMEKYVFQLIYHSGLEQNDANRAKFRKILQDSMISSGFGLKDIGESALQEVRMFKGTPGGGIDVLPEMLRAATTEAMLKGGSTPQEAMTALIGLSHMTKQYDPASIKKLAPAFAFYSTANPANLASIERAAGYAVPLLQSGLDIDPMESMLLGTALTRAGATNTKSGTWLREMALRAMPGTSLQSKTAYKKHEAALKRLGLVDEAGAPTWFDAQGKPDIAKMLDIAGPAAANIPVTERAGLERQLFGAQGGGAFALLADPAVNAQIKALRAEKDSPEFKNRYAGFTEAYAGGSTAQMARTAMADFNVTMMDIGQNVLPAVNIALKDFKGLLEGIRGVLPGGGKGGAVVGARAAEGALIGGAAGALMGGIGALPGAVIGGLTGGVYGLAEQYMAQQEHDRKEGARAYERPGDAYQRRIEKQSDAAPKAMLAPISLSLNVDGAVLARVMSSISANSFSGQAPAYDGLESFVGGDHNHTDK